MQALTLLALRATTGIYLVIWGIVKLTAPQAAIGLSDSYYHGLLSSNIINTSLGLAEIVIGLLVVLGLFRKYIYIIQGVIYGAGLLAISPYIVDPFAWYLVDVSKVTWFPSTTLFAACLVILVFKEFDTKALDLKFGF